MANFEVLVRQLQCHIQGLLQDMEIPPTLISSQLNESDRINVRKDGLHAQRKTN